MSPIQPLSRSSTEPVSPPFSTALPSRPRHTPSLSLDLSNLPPAVASSSAPAAPTNTLLLTNLNDPDVFRADNLQTLRDLVNETAPLHSWAPLRSFRRIVASFFSVEDAVRVRAAWDNKTVLGAPVQVYYGRTTPLDAGRPGHMQHLALPDAGKLFFISPPPSPPAGWQMRLEEAPNKLVHADDLADALAKLHHHSDPNADVFPPSPASAASSSPATSRSATMRSRSSTLVIYQPELHGATHAAAGSSGVAGFKLPAIAVEDLTAEPDDMIALDDSPAYDGFGMVRMTQPPIMAHTSRPPVELMHDA